jgi:hypothetical protein
MPLKGMLGPWSVFCLSLLPCLYAVATVALPVFPAMMLCLTIGPKVTGPHRLKPLKLWAKISLPSFRLSFLRYLSQWWKANTFPLVSADALFPFALYLEREQAHLHRNPFVLFQIKNSWWSWDHVEEMASQLWGHLSPYQRHQVIISKLCWLKLYIIKKRDQK